MKPKYLAIAISAILLFPTLFFPITSDIGIYALGGETIAKGGKIYVDYLDLKPPGVYMAFAAISKTIGISPIALRGVDFLIQLLTCYLLFFILDKKLRDKFSGVIAAGMYAAVYAALGFAQTLQAESFVGLGICLIFLLIDEKRTLLKMILAGMIVGLLISLKFTFAVVGLSAITYILLDSKKRFGEAFYSILWSVPGAIAGLVIGFAPLFDGKVYEEFSLVLRYLNYYSSTAPLNSEFIKESLKTLGDTFGDNISLFVIISAVIGCFEIFNKHRNDEDNLAKKLFFFFISGTLLFISIVVERKYLYYHFIRIYPMLSIFAAFGLPFIWIRLRSAFKSGGTLDKIVVITVIAFGLAFSPAPRLLGMIKPTVDYLIDYDKYLSDYERGDGIVVYRTRMDVVDYLNNTVPKDSLTLVFATGSGDFNYFRRDKPRSKFAQSQFLIGSLIIPKWQNEFAQELRRATCILIPTNDASPALTGIPNSSYEWLQKSVYWNYFSSNFKETKKIGNFMIFRRL